jgi:hypothetical protein
MAYAAVSTWAEWGFWSDDVWIHYFVLLQKNIFKRAGDIDLNRQRIYNCMRRIIHNFPYAEIWQGNYRKYQKTERMVNYEKKMYFNVVQYNIYACNVAGHGVGGGAGRQRGGI